MNICTSLMQKCGERNCQNVEISKLKTSRSPTLGKTNSKLFKNLHFATAKHTFYKKKTLRKWIHFRLFLRFQNDSFAIAKTKFGRKKVKPRARFPVRRVVFVWFLRDFLWNGPVLRFTLSPAQWAPPQLNGPVQHFSDQDS